MNALTMAQAERITVLMEEASEVIHMCSKILRHGLYSTHPDGGAYNVNLLEEELEELLSVAHEMKNNGDFNPVLIDKQVLYNRWLLKKPYMHYQNQ